MKRRPWPVLASAALFSLALLATPTQALDEADRLWMVAERAMADGLHALARRTLERFVDGYAADRRLPEAVLLLGRARLAQGDAEAALAAFRRAGAFRPPPGRRLETKFWEAEALFRLRRFPEAAAAYDEVIRTDAASPLAPDAAYGHAWAQQQQGRLEDAAKIFGDLVQTWPQHSLAPSATFYQARALADLKRFPEIPPLLEPFLQQHSTHKLLPDARFLLGWARIESGDPRGGVADLRAFVDRHAGHEQVAAARRLITQTLGRHGDRQELAEVFRALMAESPPTPEGLWDAADVAKRAGRDRDQEAAWRKLRSEFPEHPLAHVAALDLATAAYKRKEWKEVVDHAKSATKSADEGVRAEAWLLAGEAELKLKRFQAAEQAFHNSTAVKSAVPAIRYRALAGLGLAYEEQRQWGRALAAYESVAGKSPDETLRDWARERSGAMRTRLNASPGDKKPRSGS
jgi:TolA-binding protein